MNRRTFFFVLLLNLVCILSSNAQETSDDLYEKVTSVEENERYHLIAECDGKFYCAQNVLKSASFGSDEITIDQNGQFHYGPLEKNGFEFTRKGNGYKIYSYNDRKYYYIKDKKIATADAGTLDNGWILSIQTNGSAKISYTKTINASSKTYTIVFNKEIKKFVVTSNLDDNKYTLPYIYGRPTHLVGNITVSNTHWTTFYSDYDVKLPAGIDVYTISNVDEKGTLTCKRKLSVQGVAYLKKHSPALIYSEQAGAYPCYETNKGYIETDLSSNNYLRGTSSDQMIEAEDNYTYYMLTYGTIDDKKVFGFFYGAEDGEPFVNKGGKAYLAVPKSIANQSMGFALVTDNKDVTNIGNISSNPDFKSSVVTTLSGVQVKCDNKDKLPKGIYIINGKKVIVK